MSHRHAPPRRAPVMRPSEGQVASLLCAGPAHSPQAPPPRHPPQHAAAKEYRAAPAPYAQVGPGMPQSRRGPPHGAEPLQLPKHGVAHQALDRGKRRFNEHNEQQASTQMAELRQIEAQQHARLRDPTHTTAQDVTMQQTAGRRERKLRRGVLYEGPGALGAPPPDYVQRQMAPHQHPYPPQDRSPWQSVAQAPLQRGEASVLELRSGGIARSHEEHAAFMYRRPPALTVGNPGPELGDDQGMNGARAQLMREGKERIQSEEQWRTICGRAPRRMPAHVQPGIYG